MTDQQRNHIFVFGSNLAGRHGAGAAVEARLRYGARNGIGRGMTGFAYAVPTKDRQLRTLPLATIKEHMDEFIRFARTHPDFDFIVTRLGCGLAGYNNRDIAPMFRSAPSNCILPSEWSLILGKKLRST